MELANLIANIQGMTAVAVALLIGMGALGTAIGFGLHVRQPVSGDGAHHDGSGPRWLIWLAT